jgi:hypothetical protein
MRLSLLAQAEQAHKLYSKLVETLGIAKTSFVLVGSLLHQLHKNNLFKKAVGEGIDTWEDFIALPEVSLTRGEAQRLQQIYEQFVLKFGYSEEEVAQIPIKNLHYLLPIAKDKRETDDEFSELVEDAKSLTQKEFRENVQDYKFPDQELTYEFLVMEKCVETGNMKKVHGITSDLIKEKFNL